MISESIAASKVEALRAISLAAGANNGPYIDVRNFEGDLVFAYNVGAVTGSVIFKVQDATDIGGTAVADVTGAASASISTAGTTGAIILNKETTRGFVRFVATVVTGPILGAGILLSRPKTTA